MGVRLQALEIIFEVQGKRNNEKIIGKKKFANLQNVFFFFFCFLTPHTFKPQNFFIFYSF
jgi:hypothetical protein